MEKRYFINSIITFLLGLGIWMIMVVYFDPAQQFRITEFPFGDNRIINTGLAKNGNYNTLIFGSSTSQNILKKDVDNMLKVNSINLSIPGTTNYEQRKLLNVALTKVNLQKVIYGLDPFVFNRGYEVSRVPLEKFAYENSKLELYKYFYNFTTFKGIIKGLLGKRNKNWIENHGYWGNNFKYSKENTLSFDESTQWGAQNMGAVQIFKDGYSLELMKKNFDATYEMFKNNTEIEFLIYYPPYANIWWDYAERYNAKDTIVEFKEYANEKLKSLKNVKVYDFQNRSDIVNNLDNYKDMVHYSPEINKKIVEDIKMDKNRVSSYNK